MGAPIFPSNLRMRAYELRTKKQRSLPFVVKALQEEFPEYKDRLTCKIVSAINKRMKNHSGKILRASVEDRSDRFTEALFSGGKVEKDPVVRPPKTESVDVVAEARTLRENGLRWAAIVDFLKNKHPEVHVPQAGRLSLLVREKQGKATAKVFKLTLEGSSGIMLRIDLPEKKVTKIIKHILDLEE